MSDIEGLNDRTGIGRRGFIGAGLVSATAALITPAAAAAGAGGGRARRVTIEYYDTTGLGVFARA